MIRIRVPLNLVFTPSLFLSPWNSLTCSLSLFISGNSRRWDANAAPEIWRPLGILWWWRTPFSVSDSIPFITPIQDRLEFSSRRDPNSSMYIYSGSRNRSPSPSGSTPLWFSMPSASTLRSSTSMAWQKRTWPSRAMTGDSRRRPGKSLSASNPFRRGIHGLRDGNPYAGQQKVPREELDAADGGIFPGLRHLHGRDTYRNSCRQSHHLLTKAKACPFS